MVVAASGRRGGRHEGDRQVRHHDAAVVVQRHAEIGGAHYGLVGEHEPGEHASVGGGALSGVVGHEHPANLGDGQPGRDVAVRVGLR